MKQKTEKLKKLGLLEKRPSKISLLSHFARFSPVFLWKIRPFFARIFGNFGPFEELTTLL